MTVCANGASSFSITASGASDPDYTIKFVNGTLTVTPASLVITAVDKTKVYGAALPTLTASYSGLVNGDTPDDVRNNPALKGLNIPRTGQPLGRIPLAKVVAAARSVARAALSDCRA